MTNGVRADGQRTDPALAPTPCLSDLKLGLARYFMGWDSGCELIRQRPTTWTIQCGW